jgi:hypothetical protein
MKESSSMIIRKTPAAAVCLLAFSALLMAAQLDTFRLLSVSESEKLILLSQIPGKSKFLLDAASAKITLNGKPAEFKALKAFSVIQVHATFRKTTKLGIQIDGTALEIRISTDEKKD